MEAAGVQGAEKEQPARRQERTQPASEGPRPGTKAGSGAGRSRRALQASAEGVHPGGRRRRLRSQGQGARRRVARGDKARLPGGRQGRGGGRRQLQREFLTEGRSKKGARVDAMRGFPPNRGPTPKRFG